MFLGYSAGVFGLTLRSYGLWVSSCEGPVAPMKFSLFAVTSLLPGFNVLLVTLASLRASSSGWGI